MKYSFGQLVLFSIRFILRGNHVKLGALQQKVHRDRHIEDIGNLKPGRIVQACRWQDVVQIKPGNALSFWGTLRKSLVPYSGNLPHSALQTRLKGA